MHSHCTNSQDTGKAKISSQKSEEPNIVTLATTEAQKGH